MNMKAAGIRKAPYDLGAEPLTIHMVRVRKHTRLSRRGCVSTLTIHMVRALTDKRKASWFGYTLKKKGISGTPVELSFHLGLVTH